MPYVAVRLTPHGADNLAILTRQNVGRHLAIVVDEKVLSAPVIRTEIGKGQVAIQGFKSAAEAKRIARALRR